MRLIDFFIASAQAAEAPVQQTAPGGAWLQPLLLLGMFAMFYFLLIRPQRKRQKEVEQMLGQLSQNDEVATHAGLLGKVKSIQDSYVVLKVADNVELKFQKSAVNVVLPKGAIKGIQ